MKTDLYIPNKIVVGFQKRGDTFTGKLAYVIYKDHTGKLRKEGSWNSWRHKDIEPVEFDNVPTPNFTFNKGVHRDNYYFGSGRHVIRVYDPRDFEFEVSVDNTIGLLLHSDVSKRDIVEKCVYAWAGTELILLPTNSQEYQESVKHTEKQSQKIGAKELKVGATYTIKKERRQVVYLGRFDRYTVETKYEYDRYYGHSTTTQKAKSKGHVFMDPTNYSVEVKDPIQYLAYCDLEECHPEYATMLEKYYQSANSQLAIGLAVADEDLTTYGTGWWKQIGDNQFMQLEWRNDWNSTTREKYWNMKAKRFARFNETTKQAEFSYDAYDSGSYYSRQSYPGRDLPGMSVARADVVALLAELTPTFEETENAYIEARNKNLDWEETNRIKSEAVAKAKAKYGIGSLHFVLANGKISTDNYL